jgi:pimeloyl-ACP methyl ester carboxylesterase
MKIIATVAALVVAAGMAAAAFVVTSAAPPATAPQTATAVERPLIFIPGLLGSRLCRTSPAGETTVVWGTVDAIGQFPTLAVGGTDDVTPCGLIREVSYLGLFTQTVYDPIVTRLEAAGYREGETLFIFDYDWRLSILDNARRLSVLVDTELPEGQFDILGHSMGGLVARTFALRENGAGRIHRLISAGSPWRGSVQVFELMHNGWGAANLLLGGIDAFRRTTLSWASTFELMPSYDGCCTEPGQGTGFDPVQPSAWTDLKWPGIEPGALPDFTAIAERQRQLAAIVATPLPATIEEALIIGVDQRTPQTYDISTGAGEALLTVGTSWDGDGTVMRDSSTLARRVVYPTSFATHDNILTDPDVQNFVMATLADGPDVAIASVPVRPRTDILTALGELVQLVGVAVATDQPAYAAGATAKVTVHLRLDVKSPVDPAAITLTALGRPATGARLRPARAAGLRP